MFDKEELRKFLNFNCYNDLKNCKRLKNGEVFTSNKLVNQMLDTIPKKVFKNKNLKWLDPCCGKSNFFIEVYIRLIDSLTSIIDIEERHNHIINNMLFSYDIDEDNVKHSKFFFKNVFKENSLTFDFKKFDIIIMNPPYNISNTKLSGNPLYQNFLRKFIPLLNKNGYLISVNPRGWRKPYYIKSKTHDLFELMCHKNTMLYLEIHNSQDGIKEFNAATNYDFFCIKNELNKNYLTTINDEKRVIIKLNLNQWNFLPNFDINIIKELIDLDFINNLNIIYSRSIYDLRKKYINNDKTDIFKYPVIHNTNKNDLVLFYTSHIDNTIFNQPKLIFKKSHLLIDNIIVDKNDTYGITYNCIRIYIDDYISQNLNIIINILKSNVFKNVIKACNWSMFSIDYNFLKLLKKDFFLHKIFDN